MQTLIPVNIKEFTVPGSLFTNMLTVIPSLQYFVDSLSSGSRRSCVSWICILKSSWEWPLESKYTAIGLRCIFIGFTHILIVWNILISTWIKHAMVKNSCHMTFYDGLYQVPLTHDRFVTWISYWPVCVCVGGGGLSKSMWCKKEWSRKLSQVAQKNGAWGSWNAVYIL